MSSEKPKYVVRYRLSLYFTLPNNKPFYSNLLRLPSIHNVYQNPGLEEDRPYCNGLDAICRQGVFYTHFVSKAQESTFCLELTQLDLLDNIKRY